MDLKINRLRAAKCGTCKRKIAIGQEAWAVTDEDGDHWRWCLLCFPKDEESENGESEH